MNDPPQVKRARDGTAFSREVGAKAARKLKARQSGQVVWFGLGMMGLIGWSVVLPTLLGAALGGWLDNRHPGGHSWTLMLLVGGLFVGCLNAWNPQRSPICRWLLAQRSEDFRSERRRLQPLPISDRRGESRHFPVAAEDGNEMKLSYRLGPFRRFRDQTIQVQRYVRHTIPRPADKTSACPS